MPTAALFKIEKKKTELPTGERTDWRLPEEVVEGGCDG